MTLKNRILEHIILPSSPSEPVPVAVPSGSSIDDIAEAMDQSPCSKTLESEGPMDLSPHPSFPRDQDPDVNWNDQLIVPVIKTPSKGLRRKHNSPVTTPSSSKSSSSSAPPAKVPKRLPYPSPGKRYLQEQAEAQQSEEVNHSEVDSVDELVEKIVFGEVSQGPRKVCRR
jgi:hypothetical protein